MQPNSLHTLSNSRLNSSILLVVCLYTILIGRTQWNIICACGNKDLTSLIRLTRGALKQWFTLYFSQLNHLTSLVPKQNIILSTLLIECGFSSWNASTSSLMWLIRAPEVEQFTTVREPLLIIAPSTRLVIDVPNKRHSFSSCLGLVNVELNEAQFVALLLLISVEGLILEMGLISCATPPELGVLLFTSTVAAAADLTTGVEGTCVVNKMLCVYRF